MPDCLRFVPAVTRGMPRRIRNQLQRPVDAFLLLPYRDRVAEGIDGEFRVIDGPADAQLLRLGPVSCFGEAARVDGRIESEALLPDNEPVALVIENDARRYGLESTVGQDVRCLPVTAGRIPPRYYIPVEVAGVAYLPHHEDAAVVIDGHPRVVDDIVRIVDDLGVSPATAGGITVGPDVHLSAVVLHPGCRRHA